MYHVSVELISRHSSRGSPQKDQEKNLIMFSTLFGVHASIILPFRWGKKIYSKEGSRRTEPRTTVTEAYSLTPQIQNPNFHRSEIQTFHRNLDFEFGVAIIQGCYCKFVSHTATRYCATQELSSGEVPFEVVPAVTAYDPITVSESTSYWDKTWGWYVTRRWQSERDLFWRIYAFT